MNFGRVLFRRSLVDMRRRQSGPWWCLTRCAGWPYSLKLACEFRGATQGTNHASDKEAYSPLLRMAGP